MKWFTQVTQLHALKDLLHDLWRWLEDTNDMNSKRYKLYPAHVTFDGSVLNINRPNRVIDGKPMQVICQDLIG